MKFDCRIDSFQFKRQYAKSLTELMQKLNPLDVTRFFPSENTARSTINNIRAKFVTKKAKIKVKTTKDLKLSDDMKVIIIDASQHIQQLYI